jgi:hypothetical protein
MDKALRQATMIETLFRASRKRVLTESQDSNLQSPARRKMSDDEDESLPPTPIEDYGEDDPEQVSSSSMSDTIDLEAVHHFVELNHENEEYNDLFRYMDCKLHADLYKKYQRDFYQQIQDITMEIGAVMDKHQACQQIIERYETPEELQNIQTQAKNLQMQVVGNDNLQRYLAHLINPTK